MGGLDVDHAFFLIYWLTESTLENEPYEDAELAALGTAMGAIERAHGIGEDESFLLAEAPEEYRALNLRWDNRFDALWGELLRELGEPEMAGMIVRGDPALHRRHEVGRRYFRGPMRPFLADDGDDADWRSGLPRP